MHKGNITSVFWSVHKNRSWLLPLCHHLTSFAAIRLRTYTQHFYRIQELPWMDGESRECDKMVSDTDIFAVLTKSLELEVICSTVGCEAKRWPLLQPTLIGVQTAVGSEFIRNVSKEKRGQGNSCVVSRYGNTYRVWQIICPYFNSTRLSVPFIWKILRIDYIVNWLRQPTSIYFAFRTAELFVPNFVIWEADNFAWPFACVIVKFKCINDI